MSSSTSSTSSTSSSPTTGASQTSRRTLRLAAGALAGVVSRTLTAPLERVKLQRQVLGNETPFVERLRQLGAREGWRRALFRGNATNCLKVLPAGAIRFCAFEEYKEAILRAGLVDTWADDDDDSGNPSSVLPYRVACGAAAGATAVSTVYPLDVLRTRLSVQDAASRHAYGSVLNATRHILRSEGVRAFYRGFATAATSVVPFTAINFGTYDTLKQIVARRYSTSEKRPPLWTSAVLGGCSGALAMTVMFPVDVVRHRVMASAEGARQSGWQTARAVYAQGGWRQFYRGLLPSYAKVVPTVALTWFVIETCRRALGTGQ